MWAPRRRWPAEARRGRRPCRRKNRRSCRRGSPSSPRARYPSGGVIHTGIDAALQIRDELGPRGADITAIKAGISKYAASRAGSEYPANMEAAKFNLQYVIAALLVNGVPKLATFEPEAIKDSRVKALAAMVSVAIDPAFADAIEDYPTRVAVTLKDGRKDRGDARPARRTAVFRRILAAYSARLTFTLCQG